VRGPKRGRSSYFGRYQLPTYEEIEDSHLSIVHSVECGVTYAKELSVCCFSGMLGTKV
jgi:hypothetical protein